MVDQEIKRLLNTCYEEAKATLIQNRELLDEVALYLLSKETITGEELMAYVNASKKEAENNPTEEDFED